MKHTKLILMALTALFAVLPLSAQKIGDKVYKTVIVNGESISKWLLFQEVCEYDSNGNEIFTENADRGCAVYHEYDKNNLLIHSKMSTVGETWYEYDAGGNRIHSKDSSGYECWYKYDADGNRIYEKNSSGYEAYYEYDNAGNKIHAKTKDSETWYDYDNHGNCIHSKGTNENEIWNKYDAYGNVVYMKVKDIKTGKFYGWNDVWEYDSKGNVIHYSGSARDYWYEYQFSEDGKIVKKFVYTDFY